MNGQILQPLEVEQNWAELGVLLAPSVALNNGEMELEDIPKLVHERKMFIAVIRGETGIDVALALEILDYPRKRALFVSYIGGKPYALTNAKYMYTQLEKIAKVLNCSMIQGLCRPAAARLFMREFGLKPVYTVLRREVGP